MTRIIPRLSGADRTAFIAAARSLLGKPFVHKGRTENGVDCVGLGVYAFSKIGIECEDLADYALTPDGHTLQEKIEAHLGAPVKSWQPGDIVLMRWHENARSGVVYCNHVGILGTTGYRDNSGSPCWSLIHSHREFPQRRNPQNRVKEHRLSAPWDRRVFAVYSLAGENA